MPDFSKKFGYEGFVSMVNQTSKKADMAIFGEKFRTIKCNCWNPTVRLNEMKDTDITMQVLSPIPVMFCYWAKDIDTLKIARFLNDFISNTCIENPVRFLGLGTVPMQNTELAIKEMERCKEIGLKGIEIGTNINNKNLNHPDLFPFYEAAESLEMSLFIHPWEMMGMSDINEYWMPWLVGMPAETSRAICALIFGGVLRRFSKLKLSLSSR